MTIYCRFGSKLTIKRRATKQDLKKKLGKAPSSRDLERMLDGFIAITEDADGNEFVEDLALLKADGGWTEILEAAHAAKCGPDGECPSCMGYGYFDKDGNPSVDRRNKKCLDCRGTGEN